MGKLERILLLSIILFGVSMLMIGLRLTAIEKAIKEKSYFIPVINEREHKWTI